MDEQLKPESPTNDPPIDPRLVRARIAALEAQHRQLWTQAAAVEGAIAALWALLPQPQPPAGGEQRG
jgi:hypothetical protein